MIKTIATLIFAAAGALQQLERGTFQLGKGKRLEGVELDFTIPVKNNGGAGAAMSDAERMALLRLLKIKDFSYGKGGAFKRYIGLTFDRLRTVLFNRCYGVEFVGYTNSTNGLAKVIAAGATDNLRVTIVIPTGKNIRCPDLVQGMGRSQAATLYMQFELSALSSASTGNFAINGNVTADVRPDTESEPRGDVWANLIEVLDTDDTRKEFTLEDGLTVDIFDRNAAHSATGYTSNTLKIDEETMYAQVAPSVVSAVADRAANIPSVFSNVRTYETEIYGLPFDVKTGDIQTGRPTFTQDNKVVATAKMTQVYYPIEDQTKLAEAFAHVAKKLRPKPLHGVSYADAAGKTLPERQKFAAGWTLRDADDAEFNSLPGLTADGESEKAVMRIPPLVAQRAKAAIKSASGAEAAVLAEKIQKQVASSIPGAITNGRGFSRGISHAYDWVRAQLG